MLNGVINIDKPRGISSSLAVSRVRRALGVRKAGHMGTLDPMGEGVLVMGVGKCTRLFDYFLTKSKTYEASFKFGMTTDTLDITGAVTGETAHIPTMSDIISALPRFTGKISQLPPQYSAKSVGGRRAYELARKGIAAELRPSEVTVYSFLPIGEIGENEYMFSVECSSGTYIRSLCRDLAESLGSLAVMTSLRRTRCGAFTIDDAVSPDEARAENVIPPEKALAGLPFVEAPSEQFKRLSCGVPIDLPGVPDGPFALGCAGVFFGIASRGERGVRVTVNLREDEV